MMECENAFTQLKEYLVHPSLLAKLKPMNVLLLYLTVFEHATSSKLLREKNDRKLLTNGHYGEEVPKI